MRVVKAKEAPKIVDEKEYSNIIAKLIILRYYLTAIKSLKIIIILNLVILLYAFMMEN